MGRRKIEIKMVKDTNSRQVTFSKRRTGLFKKANELSILCGAEVAIVVFSPGNKPFSFGHPGVEAVAAKFLHKEPKSNAAHGRSTLKVAKIDKLNQQLADLMDQLHVEEKKGEMHDQALNQHKLTQCKMATSGLNLADLQDLKGSLEELKKNTNDRANEMEALSSMLLLAEKPVKGKRTRVAKRKRMPRSM